MNIINHILNYQDKREIKKIEGIVSRINQLELQMQNLPNEQFPKLTQNFKDRILRGESLDDILPEAFAACREAAFRAIGLRHFDVQLLGGIVLHNGDVAEMKTGEGKTLVASLPAYLNSLTGKGVHIVTVNDYLAKRDSEWMGKIYSFLGLTVGCIVSGCGRKERQQAYRCDITYGTNSEFGFDYLRDNMIETVDDLMQRELNYAIIDEADSILIDEARTPLIISGETNESVSYYKQADQLIREFDETDYIVDEKKQTVALTDNGVIKAESFFKIKNIADLENIEIHHRILQALKAHKLIKKDVAYVVKDGKIVIVDEFTGRLMNGRRYSDGLHQAIEAKENLEIKKENQTLATITLQNYFRMYQKLSGMTGTAKTEESELMDIYNMIVIQIPTNKPINRVDKDDLVFMTKKEKIDAIIDKIKECYDIKRPVLVGTISVEKSEELSELLKRQGIPHNILNAKYHEQEAEIIAEAGRLGTVTIATNMAGRGTDIILGGTHEKLLKRKLAEIEELEENDYLIAEKKIFKEIEDLKDAEHKAVVELGGLYIIGTDRHESRRIDNQLRGRAGRQGDPGTTEFFLSLEDDLLRLFGGSHIKTFCDKLGTKEDRPIKSRVLTKTIENAQKGLEGQNSTIRKYILQYDDVNNKQRTVVYGDRKKVLQGEDLSSTIWSMLETIIQESVEDVTAISRYPEEWNLEELFNSIHELYEDFIPPEFSGEILHTLTKENIINEILKQLGNIYKMREKEYGTQAMRDRERKILIQVLDYKWIEHIDDMEQFKSGIGLRALGQEDPARMYSIEGFEMFQQMIRNMELQVTSLILKKQESEI